VKTYPCCKCCPSDPIFHEDNPADSHEVPCDSCALNERVRPVIQGLIDRLERADLNLRANAYENTPDEIARLLAKADGVRLARSYAEELLR
jgi:hypothetical protein